MVNIIGAMAEFERELMREWVKAGLKKREGEGTRIGRPRKIVDTITINTLRLQADVIGVTDYLARLEL